MLYLEQPKRLCSIFVVLLGWHLEEMLLESGHLEILSVIPNDESIDTLEASS